MRLKFSKYQGCGNDFILIDQRGSDLHLTTETIKYLCDRRFGIGADGLMELIEDNHAHFGMRYYNSDGNESSFCGNGGRCITQFAHDIGVFEGSVAHFRFRQSDYEAIIQENGTIALNMQDVQGFNEKGDDLFFCTGSPHYVHFTEDVDTIELIPYARGIRYSEEFTQGINVNIVQKVDDHTLKMRTYERGVEDETLSCGTGVTAAAIAFHFKKMTTKNTIHVQTRGGEFQVKFDNTPNGYTYVKLIGPAEKVFDGEVQLL